MDALRLPRTIEMDCPFCGSPTVQVMAECDHQSLAWCQQCFRPRFLSAEELARVAAHKRRI